MAESRKIAAILCSDVVGYSRLAGADEDRILARLRALRSDLIDPTIAVHNGRVVKRTGDGSIVEFRSVVDAVRCAIEVQNAMVDRNAGVPFERQIVFRIGIHLGDVVEESDGDLMGDGVNIAARLEGMAAPGAICLSEDAYRQVSGRLDMEVTDLGPTQLKNIARPIRAYSLQVGVPAVAKPATRARLPEPKKRSLLGPLVAGIVALAAVAGGTWYFLAGNRAATAQAPAEAARLSLVVLPFTNLSGDPAQDYFADGITENLTTELSHIHDSFVIARNTAFTFKGKNVDAKEVGRELGVRYVLEGSVQRDGNRVRVNAQLIDAGTGAHLWADRFEEDLADLFKLQDELVAQLANSTGYELMKAEAISGSHATNPDAIDLSMRGWNILNSPAKKEEFVAAHDIFIRALTLDPRNVEAMVGLAYVDLRAFLYGWSSATTQDAVDEALSRLDKANEIDRGFAYGYYVRSLALFAGGRYADAVEAANTATKLNPNLAHGYFATGQAEWPLGQCDQAISHINQAFKISPRDPLVGAWLMNVGNAESCLGHYDAAIEDYKRSVVTFRPYVPYMFWAVAAALKGDDAEAKRAMAQAKSLAPNLTIQWFKAHGPTPKFVEEGLRRAGLQED
jgi:adenylate cyclase